MPVRGVDCSDPKEGSCNLWNPTSFREAHGDVLIRNDIPLMCRGLFFPLLCALGPHTPHGFFPPKHIAVGEKTSTH